MTPPDNYWIDPPHPATWLETAREPAGSLTDAQSGDEKNAPIVVIDGFHRSTQSSDRYK
jgi:hypothetical protein